MTDAVPTGKTQAVIFDFDGTLTKDKLNHTTWESIWINLGYSEKHAKNYIKNIIEKKYLILNGVKLQKKNLKNVIFIKKT